ncbi:MAG: TIGR01777 family protein [Hymenobacteraceae bacterium]|nr:TIGR01777 family protein [Hymenobacteraceae bacterium]
MNILITGGTGLVGTRLSQLLTAAGHSVAHLSRSAGAGSAYRTFRWNPLTGQLDPAAVPWADAIVHLAGAGVMDERWTPARKQEFLESRVRGLHLLRDALATDGTREKALVSASAIGFYGDRGDAWLSENTPPPAPGQDFLADVCRQWEAAALQLRATGRRVAILRLGIVLSTAGGALPEMARPVKLGAGAALGSGRQWLSWIHLDDACRAFVAALTNARYTGVYNVVGPAPVTNASFTRALAAVLHRPLVLPAVPSFALRLALGERAHALLASQRVRPDGLTERGFAFDFPEVGAALTSLYGEG